MRPPVVEFGEEVRQMERPVGREIDDGSDSFRSVVAFGGHSLDRDYRPRGVSAGGEIRPSPGTKGPSPALPSSPDTLRDPSLIRGALGGVYETISNVPHAA